MRPWHGWVVGTVTVVLVTAVVVEVVVGAVVVEGLGVVVGSGSVVVGKSLSGSLVEVPSLVVWECVGSGVVEVSTEGEVGVVSSAVLVDVVVEGMRVSVRVDVVELGCAGVVLVTPVVGLDEMTLR